MPEDVSISSAEPRRVMPVLLLAGVMALLLTASAALWAHYGTAVFFETVRAGLVACFG
jgi:hypothetical protein